MDPTVKVVVKVARILYLYFKNLIEMDKRIIKVCFYVLFYLYMKDNCGNKVCMFIVHVGSGQKKISGSNRIRIHKTLRFQDASMASPALRHIRGPGGPAQLGGSQEGQSRDIWRPDMEPRGIAQVQGQNRNFQ